MTTLVTGAGVIGSLTARLLAEAGGTVVLADLREPPFGLNITPVALDVSDLAALERCIEQHGVTRIVHTAAMLSNSIRQSPLDGIRVNIMGSANILELARQKQLGRIVIASSTTVGYPTFGSHGPDPITEDFSMRVLSEGPASIYAATKLCGEHLAQLYAALYGVDVICLRYAAVLGGSLQHPTSVPGQLLALLADGARTGHAHLDNPLLLWGGREEFVDARDCARANMLALKAPTPIQRVFNIAGGEWFTFWEFIEAAKRTFGAFAIDLPPEPATGFAGFPHRRPAHSDLEAANRDLGFQAKYRLTDTMDWMANPMNRSV